MAALRVCFSWLFIVIALEFSFLSAEESKDNASAGGLKGNCSCGGFPTSTPEPGSAPLLSQTSLVVKCDQEGENTCKLLCNALATATKAKGPEVLCIKLKEANELKLSAFYKTCDNPWQYADMTANFPLCCENSKVKVCPSVTEHQPAETDKPAV